MGEGGAWHGDYRPNFRREIGQKAEALDSADAVIKALARVESERAEAASTIDRALEQRRDLLLRDETDKQIAALDAAVDAAHLVLERLELAEPQLHARLREFLDAERRQRLAELRHDYDDAAKALDAAMDRALEAFAEHQKVVQQLDAEDFSAEGREFIIPPPYLGNGIAISAETLELWRQQRDRAAAVALASPWPAKPAA